MKATVPGALNILEDRINAKEVVSEDYRKSFCGKSIPIIIDNGIFVQIYV